MRYRNFAQTYNNRAGQVPNSAGGFAYAVDKWTRLNRFLILGSESGTYYITPQALTTENANAVFECLKEDPDRTINTIVEISQSGRAARNDHAIFALALACVPKFVGQHNTRAALAAIPAVCRTGTHLFQFYEYVHQYRGDGRALRRGISNWYLEKDLNSLAYQVTKYQQRNGISQRDMLRIAHPKTNETDRNAIFRYIVSGEAPEQHKDGAIAYIEAVEWAKIAKEATTVAALIGEFNLPWEAIPTPWLRDADVRMALLRSMPLNAMVRQLGVYASLGLAEMRSEGERIILENLQSVERIHKSRIHPFQLLLALQTYSQGRGQRGSNAWLVNSRIAEALEGAFYTSFENVEASQRRILLGVDISGSMGYMSSNIAGLNDMPASYAASALALMMVNVEPYCDTVAFDTQAYPRNLNKRSSIIETMKQFVPKGGTDCGSVIDWAASLGVVYDAFIIFTDSETWKNNSNPYQRFVDYREKINRDAKLITVAMVSNNYSLGPANTDVGVLDCVGFDSSVPTLILDFLRAS